MDFDLALATTFMSTAAAFLECDPRPKCPVEDTYNFGNGGSSKDESNEKVNPNNIVDKVKETTVPEGAFNISAKGKAEALNNRLNAANNFSDTTNVLGGSFDTSTITGGNILPESIEGFDTSNFLPEGKLNLIPKKKFNLPKIETTNEEEGDQ